MTETLLITIDDIKAVKQISANMNVTERVLGYISEAQVFDVKPRLGSVFYHDLITNVSSTIYQELLSGKTYTDSASQSHHFLGLKPAIAYYAYARFILNSQASVTPFGAVRKLDQSSEPLNEKSLVRISTQARMAGDALLDDVIAFLNIKVVDYPKWQNNSECNPGRSSRPTIYGIG